MEKEFQLKAMEIWESQLILEGSTWREWKDEVR